jgi:transposase
MPRPPALPVPEKISIIMSVLTKEHTVAEAARRARVSEQSIANWRKQFIDGGESGLRGSVVNNSSQREEQLLAEIRKLKTALGEAYVEIMTWRKVGSHRSVPSQTSR